MADVGPGIIIITIVWVIAIVLCIVFTRSEGWLAYFGIACVLIAVIVTLILCLYPRGTQTSQAFVIYDYTYIPRTALISICGIMLFIGSIVVAVFHVFDLRRSMPLKSWVY
jgi:hypothetical protein